MYIPKRSMPTMRVMATYSDRELLEALLDYQLETMPDTTADDFDREGIDIDECIQVPRLALREALRRLEENIEDSLPK